jgi:PhnB protein
MAKAIPEGYYTVTPHLVVKDAGGAIEFYKKAFGATVVMCMAEPGGRVGHAEIRIGGAAVMIGDEYPEYGFRGPQTIGGSPVTIHLYVEDVDAFVGRAVAAGAQLVQPVKDEFWGDRCGKLQDPYGHVWYFATRKEDVTPEEITRRFESWSKKAG